MQLCTLQASYLGMIFKSSLQAWLFVYMISPSKVYESSHKQYQETGVSSTNSNCYDHFSSLWPRQCHWFLGLQRSQPKTKNLREPIDSTLNCFVYEVRWDGVASASIQTLSLVTFLAYTSVGFVCQEISIECKEGASLRQNREQKSWRGTRQMKWQRKVMM